MSPLDGIQLTVVLTLDEAMECKRWLGEKHANDAIAIDTETTGLDPRAPGAGVRMIQFGDTRTAFALPWNDWRGLALEMMEAWEGDTIYHNANFERKFLETHSDTWTYAPSRSWDTMLAAHIIDPLGSGALKSLTSKHIDKRAVVGQRLLDHGMSTHGWGWHDVPVTYEPYWTYAALDAILTSLLWDKFKPQVGPGGVYADVMALEMATLDVIAKMERRGAAVDLEYSAEQQEKLLRKAGTIKQWGKDTHGINIASPPQLGKKLIELGAVITETTPTGNPKVDKILLKFLSNPENELSQEVQDLARGTLIARESLKTANTYFGNFQESAHDGLLRPSIKTLGARTARMSISQPALQQCVDADTEVLTPTGWVQFPDLDDITPVAQYHEDGTLEFVVPEQVIRQPYQGEMVVLGLWGREFLYTPDHRVISYARPSRTHRVFTEEAHTWAERISHAASPKTIDRHFARAGFIDKGRKLTDSERASLRLAVVCQADGNRRDDTAVPKYNISVVRTRKLERLREFGVQTFASHEYKHEARGVGSEDYVHRAWILASDVDEWLDDSKEKNFRTTILELCAEDLAWFIEELFHWDGDFTRRALWSQAEKRHASVDIVQAAAAMSGFSTSSYHLYQGHGATALNINRRPIRGIGNSAYASSVQYDGDVYCVTVPTGMFLTRRNGAVIVTGNCPKRDGLVRTAFIPRTEGNVLVACDYSQIEMRLMAHFSQDKGLVEAFERADNTGGDFFVEIGKMVYRAPDFQKSDPRRGLIKNLSYGKAYGAGVAKLAESAGVSKNRMQAVSDSLDVQFPGLSQFMSRVEQVGTKRERQEGQGYVVTPLGRRLPCDPMKSYTLTNYVIQSTAADILKQAMCRLDQSKFGEYMVLPVHDEVLFDMPEELVEEALIEIPRIMKDSSYSVNLPAEAEGPFNTWGQKYA